MPDGHAARARFAYAEVAAQPLAERNLLGGDGDPVIRFRDDQRLEAERVLHVGEGVLRCCDVAERAVEVRQGLAQSLLERTAALHPVTKIDADYFGVVAGIEPDAPLF